MKTKKKNWFFLSFRDVERDLNLGVCIVEATVKTFAIDEAWKQKCNPGGEVFVYPVESPESEGLKPNRLYTRQEMLDRKYEVGV